MEGHAIPLGPFVLNGPIGKGGMGEVWRGEHREQRLPVAIKVMTVKGTQDEFFLRAFESEVRAVAGLDHPSIVMVFDHGRITDEAEALSQGALRRGSPYLVMELAAGGSLERLAGRLAWPAIRVALLCILDALAHAHASGVIHRDLKPSNILMGGMRPGVKLTDFGLAHALGREPATAGADYFTGTPAYMAPEQFQGAWREYGTWTDLYALGCLGYALVCGAPPFGRPSTEDTMNAQIHAPMPPLRARMAVPQGLDAWLRRLLQKEPGQRFRRAADAAWALLALDRASFEMPVRIGVLPPTPPGETAPPATSKDAGSIEIPGDPDSAELERSEIVTLALPREAPRLTPVPLAPSSGGCGGSELASIPVPPIPASWRSAYRRATSVRLLGAGLGLYGLRTIALVDREPERDTLWQALREVRHEGRARLVVLRGPAGCGKSRLAEWIGQRAHELGAAGVLRATHGPTAGPYDGLAAMVARHLRCVGLAREEVLARVEGLLREQILDDPEEPQALTELIAPAPEPRRGGGRRAGSLRLASPAERHVLVRRLLERLCAERPVILLLEDVQWGLDALAFTAHLLDAQATRPSPILAIATTRDEALAERSGEAALLGKLIGRKHAAQSIEVLPLPPEHRPALVRELLGLEGDLAALVEARTAGNPMFAVQLVGDWVQRGLLEVGERGFRLRPGARADLPDDLHHVSARRIDQVLAQHPEADGHALELAAVLGHEVDSAEWEDACGRAGLTLPSRLLWELLVLRLARGAGGSENAGPAVVAGRRGAGWAFVHGMLRESLERRAREGGRWEQHHRTCAAMLRERPGRATAERLGHHLIGAGEVAQALEPLREGARARIVSGDYEVAEALLVERERAMETLPLPTGDARWGEGWVLRSRAAHFRGELGPAETLSARAQNEARRHQPDPAWARVLATALLEGGTVARFQGDLARAWSRFEEAGVLATGQDDRALFAQSRTGMAHVLVRRGSLDEAAVRFEEARRDFAALGDALSEAVCLQGLGMVKIQAGKVAEAAAHQELARERFEQCGCRWGVGFMINDLAEGARSRGDLEAAEVGFRTALARLRSIGSGAAFAPEMNLGMLLVQRGEYDEARRILEDLIGPLQASGRRSSMVSIHASLLACAGGARDWSAWDRHLCRTRELLAETGWVDVDIPRMARLAGDLARGVAVARAQDAYAIAVGQWRALGREGDALEVQGLIQS